MTTGDKTLDTSNDDEFSSFIHSSPPVVTPELIEAITNWNRDGLPHFVKLLDQLFVERIIQDPMIHTLLFNVLGGYFVNFGHAQSHGNDVLQSHELALGTLMNDPALSTMVNQFMRNAVNEQISKVVE